MTRSRLLSHLFFAAALWLASLVTAAADQITVFAAASLRGALDDIAAQHTEETGQEVLISYAGSPVLARQIEQGAPADLYISASAEWMDYLADRDHIHEGNRVDLLRNQLVVIAHGPDAPLIDIADLPDLLGGDYLAMALVDAVPAGQYGQAALRHHGVWEALAPRVAQTDNVRAALALVALGEAPFGIVYATDAMAEPQVSIVGFFPPESHPPITYPAAALTDAGASFLAYLQSTAAQDTFLTYGFLPPPGTSR